MGMDTRSVAGSFARLAAPIARFCTEPSHAAISASIGDGFIPLSSLRCADKYRLA